MRSGWLCEPMKPMGKSMSRPRRRESSLARSAGPPGRRPPKQRRPPEQPQRAARARGVASSRRRRSPSRARAEPRGCRSRASSCASASARSPRARAPRAVRSRRLARPLRSRWPRPCSRLPGRAARPSGLRRAPSRQRLRDRAASCASRLAPRSRVTPRVASQLSLLHAPEGACSFRGPARSVFGACAVTESPWGAQASLLAAYRVDGRARARRARPPRPPQRVETRARARRARRGPPPGP